ncbi:hypothetical protein T06_11676 [Trichinella sp. T6]|nr:hypothetical protein T06_11676 [Trichinella sp. T6]
MKNVHGLSGHFAHLKKFMQTSFETTFNSNFQSPTTATYAALLKHYIIIQVQFSLYWSHENKLSHIGCTKLCHCFEFFYLLTIV